jgi:FkbM family methyltransferase
MTAWTDMSDCPRWWALLCQQTGTLAFDIGANGGVTAGIFAEHFDEVIALEPARESFGTLKSRAPENVLPIQMAVSDHDGAVLLREARTAMETGQLVTEGMDWGETLGHREVKCLTLDSLVLLYGCPDMVKVDVEGHEVQVMKGASKLIAEHDTTWMIEIHDRLFGVQIEQMFMESGGWRTEEHRHSHYEPGSALWAGHWYLKAEPC